MKKYTKTRRVAVRMLPNFYDRLQEAAKVMHTSMGDLMLCGALALCTKAHTVTELLLAKAQIFSDDAEDQYKG